MVENGLTVVRCWGGWLGGADLALARKLRLLRVKVEGNLFTFEREDFIHFFWELMAKSYEGVRICVSDFISQSSHHCIDVSWHRISINSLRVDRPHARNHPIWFQKAGHAYLGTAKGLECVFGNAFSWTLDLSWWNVAGRNPFGKSCLGCAWRSSS